MGRFSDAERPCAADPRFVDEYDREKYGDPPTAITLEKTADVGPDTSSISIEKSGGDDVEDQVADAIASDQDDDATAGRDLEPIELTTDDLPGSDPSDRELLCEIRTLLTDSREDVRKSANDADPFATLEKNLEKLDTELGVVCSAVDGSASS